MTDRIMSSGCKASYQKNRFKVGSEYTKYWTRPGAVHMQQGLFTMRRAVNVVTVPAKIWVAGGSVDAVTVRSTTGWSRHDS